MFSVVLMMFSDELRRSTDVLRCYQIFPNDLRIRDYHFSFETSQFRDFCQFLEVLVSENLASEKSFVSVSKTSISEKLV